MRKLFFLIPAILLIAAMVVPSAAASSDTGAGQKLVCITFDDGWQNQYDNALPVLQQYGFKATFAVVTNWDLDGVECMDYPELHALADQGMDIASHTRTHAHLPTLGASALQNEVAGSKADLEGQGFTVRTLVYPYYEYNPGVIVAARNAGYLCGRSGAQPKPYDPADRSDPDAQYKIDAIQIDTQDLDTFKGIVDQATERSVICLCYHSVSDPGAPTPRTPVANFSQQMQYLKDNSFTVALLPDLVQSPWITCTPAGLGFSGMQGGSVPATQALNISNSGGGALTWTASSSAAWLTLSPAGGAAPGTITVTADTTGLSANTYNGTITISATDATNTPLTVPVTLTVQTPSSNWLTGWSYRKQITIAGSSAGAQTNYPMKLTINRSTGADSGATVFLGTKCESNYNDIRFTKYDGSSPLDYWIESSTSSTATVWVELDSIPASPGAATFNLYYGNSGAMPASNIKNTFTFADDFDDGFLDASMWTIGGATDGTVAESDGLLTVTASTNQKYAASLNAYSNAYSLHTRARLDSITSCTSFRLIGFVTTRGSYADKLFTTAHRWYSSGANFVAISGNGSSATQSDMNVPVDTNFHVSECRRYAVSGANYDSFIMGEGAAVSGAKPTSSTRYIYIDSDEQGKAIIVDWIFLRKFVSPEPTWAGWGSEETCETPESPIIYFSPASLTFSGTQGGSNPPTQALNISNSGGGALSWTASSNATWLTMAPTGGAAPGTITVTASTTGLSAGDYNGAITIAATGATNTPQTVPVTLTVQALPPAPTIFYSPASLTFSGMQGGGNPATQALNITNSGGGTLTWTASSDTAWLTPSPTGGTAPVTVTVTADTTGLSAGAYNGTITITAPDATNTPQIVPVTLTVSVSEPGAPTLSSPADASPVGTLTPRLEWNVSTYADSYGVQVSADSGFGATVVNQTGTTNHFYDMPAATLNWNTTYYWRVNATNTNGISTWSTIWSFQPVPPAPGDEIGTYLNGTWQIDYNGNGAWNGAVTDRQYSFGSASMKPVTGDWNNDGKTEIGAYCNGTWYLDYNGNGAWNGAVTDRQYSFGSASMKPITGDWNNDGKTEIGAYYNGTWYLDYNGNGKWNGPGTDRLYTFGNASMFPVSGNWNGAGGTEIGAYLDGTWYLDYNGNGKWNGPGTDRLYTFGNASMTPVSGNWNGAGGTEIGTYLNGTWYLDYNGNGHWDGAVTDKQYSFGSASMTPVTGAY